MKKRILAIVLAVATVLTLAGCGGKFTCDFCDEEKTGTSYTVSILGEKMTICKDCKSELY